MAMNIAEDLYDLVLQLPAGERLRLVEKIAHDLSGAPQAAPLPRDAAAVAGAAVRIKSSLPTLPRDAWEAALGTIALGGDALADSEAYYDAR